MTIRNAVEAIDADFPNQFSDERKTGWVSQVEHQIISEIMLLNPADYENYHWAYDADRELVLPEPYAQLYTLYLAAQMHLAYHEADNYQNTMQLFNAVWDECSRWYADTYRPAELALEGRARPMPIETWRQGETITIEFVLPYEAEQIKALSVRLISYDRQNTYTLENMTIEGRSARLTLSSDTTAAMATGVWQGIALLTTTEDVTMQSGAAYRMRIVDVSYGVI
jgi:hypothetical protein